MIDNEDPARPLYSSAYQLLAHVLTADQRDALRAYEDAIDITKQMLLDNRRMGDDAALGEMATRYGPEAAQQEIRDWFDALDDWHRSLARLASLLPRPSDLLTIYLEHAAGDFYSALNGVRRAAVFHFLGTAGPAPEIDDRKLAVGGQLIALDACSTAEVLEP